MSATARILLLGSGELGRFRLAEWLRGRLKLAVELADRLDHLRPGQLSAGG